MEILKELILTLTGVSIFSVVILNIIGENNPQREIVKIGLGCVMIICLVSPFRVNGFNVSNIIDSYYKYEVTANEAAQKSELLQLSYIASQVESLIFEKLNIETIVDLDTDYNIISVQVYDENINRSALCELIGINDSQIEYIESR